MNIKGIIFDLDGVLVFTDRLHYAAWKRLADEEGIEFNEEINLRLRGVSRMESLEIVLEKSKKSYTPEEKLALAERKNAYYVESLASLSEKDVKEEDKATLRALKETGLRLAVASSSKNTLPIMEKTGLLSYFDEIADGTMIANSKPDPEVFLLAAKKLALDPSDCIVVEDAEAGIVAANRGGFLSVGIGPASALPIAKKSIERISDLLTLLNGKEKTREPILKLEHLQKVYPNGYEAVHDFSLDVYEEEFVVFVGPSGCGKSTVLRMIAGLEEVTDGNILLNGRDITDEESKDRDIAMVFQNYALYPHMTVRKNIAFPLTLQKIPFKHFFDFKYRKERKKRINEAVEAAAERIGLTDYLDVKPENLSGGQRQRVALGRAIVRNPKVFLLDEPLSNLDAKMRVSMRAEISKLHDKLHTIFVYVTHDQVEAMTMGSKIVILKDGWIQQIGTPEDVFLNPVNQFVAGFIGTPQMNFLSAQVSEEEGKRFALINGKKVLLPGKRMEHFDKKHLHQDLVLGVRPKAIRVSGDLGYAEQGFQGHISLLEQLGEETILHASFEGLEGDLIISALGLGRFHKGEDIGLCFDLTNVCLFDKESGESLL